MDSSAREREKSLDLNVGYDPQNRLWDVIVKYTGNIRELESDTVTVVPLLNGYAVVTLPESEIRQLSSLTEVEYIEKPKRLFFAEASGKEISCIPQIQREPYSLTGREVLVGIVDSGADYRHPDFCREDGSSRILRLWDQTVSGKPPQGYRTGTVYTKQEIDRALELPREEGDQIVPSRDLSGHGTSVLGIAAGNGRALGGTRRGIAFESDLLVVKLGTPREDSFPRTTELIQGVDYLIHQSLLLQRPIAINLSFGNNYGSHQGTSLLETYLDQVSDRAGAAYAWEPEITETSPCTLPGLWPGGRRHELRLRSLPMSVCSISSFGNPMCRILTSIWCIPPAGGSDRSMNSSGPRDMF